jgi:hypothetical protein
VRPAGTTATAAPATPVAANGAPAPPAAAPNAIAAQRVAASPQGAKAPQAGRGGARRASLPLLRPIVARFRLRRAGRIHIAVQQLAPVCRALRGYMLDLPKGAHAFRFPAARITRIGTYRLIGTIRGRRLFAVRARRLPRRVVRGGSADVSRTLSAHAIFSLATPGTLAAAAAARAHGQLHLKSAHGSRPSRVASPPPTGGAPPPRNPLVRAVSLTNVPSSLRPLLLTLLAIAIVLLSLAAAPQRLLPAGRAGAIVASRRIYFAAAGIWLLLVVAVVTAVA